MMFCYMDQLEKYIHYTPMPLSDSHLEGGFGGSNLCNISLIIDNINKDIVSDQSEITFLLLQMKR